MSKKRKDWYIDFQNFFDKPSRESLEELLDKHNFENENLDYKESWDIDRSSLARIILSFANNKGGCIIFGVKEDSKKLDPIGVSAIEDEVEFRSSIEKYIPESLKSHVQLINVTVEKKTFQIIFIEDLPNLLPFISTADGKNIQNNQVYFRNGSKSEKVNNDQFQGIIDRRIKSRALNASSISLKEDLEELNILFSSIEKGNSYLNLGFNFTGLPFEYKKNKKYPKEDYEDFIINLIKEKKEKIRNKVLR